MKILVVGSGAREHAIIWKLIQSPQVDAIYVAPGNAGTTALGTNLSIASTDIIGLIGAVRQHGIGMTFVGPEVPLAQGIVNRFQDEGLAILGPTKTAARIEASKAFAKEFMKRHGIPCAQSVAFDSYMEAERFIQHRNQRLVVKADGLAAGKGVTVANSRAEALAALDACLNEGVFGDAGAVVVIEEFLEGKEVSVFGFTDGQNLSPLVAACDYKRVYDGDQGSNTGGMGSYTPPEFWNEDMAHQAEKAIFNPTILGMAEEGDPYTGVLYAGLMLTRQGLRVLEFNARLGDPEAQVILPLLETDLMEIAQAIHEGELTKTQIRWGVGACVGVVVVSAGYPEKYDAGHPITGLDEVNEGEALVFHAGTRMQDEAIVTDGGRVLTVVGHASTMAQARKKAYAAAELVRFQGAFYRRDIALFAASIGTHQR